jgi:hypothetical protein
MEEISNTRTAQGINPSRLFVLEFSSVDFDLSASFEERFKASVVEERAIKSSQGNVAYQFIVQFPDILSLQSFQAEVELYRTGAIQRGKMTKRLRDNFFDGLQQVRKLSREDRLGSRLRQEDFPNKESFYLDVDLWHPGDRNKGLDLIDEIRELCNSFGGSLSEQVLTTSLVLVKVRGSRTLAEALLDSDLVARVDLPPILSEAYSGMFQAVNFPNPTVMPLEDDPLVCVVDSGVVAGHPLLANWLLTNGILTVVKILQLTKMVMVQRWLA